MEPKRMNDATGQVVPLVMLLLALVVIVVLVVGDVGALVARRSQAQNAADAAALAGAAGGEAAARRLAEANGAVLVVYAESESGAVVDVRVRVGTAHARARAERAGTEATAVVTVPGGGDRRGLAPALLAALARADALLRRPVPVVSGFRTAAEQQALWNRRGVNPYPVARPGTSTHERGMAIDVPASFVAALRTVAAEAGLCQPLPRTDPVHFVPCPLANRPG
jgi:hypothetical protein